MNTSKLMALAVALCLAGPLQAQPASGPAAKPAPHAPPVDTYGSTTSYYTISETEFTPVDTSTHYSSNVGLAGFQKWSTTIDGVFVASPNLPSGALITGFELDYCDSNPTIHINSRISGCDYTGINCMFLGSLLQSTNNGCAYVWEDVSSAGWTVDNYRNRLNVAVVTDSGDSSNTFSGVTIYYQLQVSPAPTTASFVDVPTTSPIFRFVEALKASGITGGCDATHFCPSAALTRGQMAVFLAAGLGLQWP